MSGRTPPFVSTRVGRYLSHPIREVFSHEPFAPRRRRHALLRQFAPLDRSSGDRAAHLGGSGPGPHAGTPGDDGWPPAAGREPRLRATASALPGARRPRRGGAAGATDPARADSGVRRPTRRGGRPTRPRRHSRPRSRQGGGQVDPTPGTYLAATTPKAEIAARGHGRRSPSPGDLDRRLGRFAPCPLDDARSGAEPPPIPPDRASFMPQARRLVNASWERGAPPVGGTPPGGYSL